MIFLKSFRHNHCIENFLQNAEIWNASHMIVALNFYYKFYKWLPPFWLKVDIKILILDNVVFTQMKNTEHHCYFFRTVHGGGGKVAAGWECKLWS